MKEIDVISSDSTLNMHGFSVKKDPQPLGLSPVDVIYATVYYGAYKRKERFFIKPIIYRYLSDAIKTHLIHYTMKKFTDALPRHPSVLPHRSPFPFVASVLYLQWHFVNILRNSYFWKKFPSLRVHSNGCTFWPTSIVPRTEKLMKDCIHQAVRWKMQKY